MGYMIMLCLAMALNFIASSSHILVDEDRTLPSQVLIIYALLDDRKSEDFPILVVDFVYAISRVVVFASASTSFLKICFCFCFISQNLSSDKRVRFYGSSILYFFLIA